MPLHLLILPVINVPCRKFIHYRPFEIFFWRKYIHINKKIDKTDKKIFATDSNQIKKKKIQNVTRTARPTKLILNFIEILYCKIA